MLLEVLVIAIRQDTEIKYIQNEREIKLSIFADHMTLYIENLTFLPKKKKLLELINELTKVSEYKINIQDSVAFPYSNNKYQKEKAIKQSI